MKKNKKITLDSLALMIGEGFSDMGKRFERVDQRFESLIREMQNNFDIVRKQINRINLNIVDVVRREEFDKLEQRVTNLEEN